MKILLVTNKVKTYAFATQININAIHELGHEVVWAADFTSFIGDTNQIPCVLKNIAINTNPLKLTNIKAYHQLLNIIDANGIEAVMCSTPIGGTLARLAAKKRKIKPVVYTAHGFLFFNGAPLINRTIFKWVEKWLAHYTDSLITITNEDYTAAQRFKLRGGNVPYLIHGAGIKLNVKVETDRIEKRREIGIPQDSFLVISAGELNKNKNTSVVVRALAELNDDTVHYVACGVGPEEENLRKLAKSLGLDNNFHLLGYRTDIAELMAASDAFVMMSFREGLPRSIMEAMDLGLPCIGSDTRGIRDLIDVNKGGYICNPRKPDEFASAIKILKESPFICREYGEYNKEKVKPFSWEVVKKELLEIYGKALQ